MWTAENIVAVKIKRAGEHTIKYGKKFNVCNYFDRGIEHSDKL